MKMHNRIIRTNDIHLWREQLAKLASDPNKWMSSYDDPANEFNQEAILEFPCGEIAEDSLKTIALIGREVPQPQAIDKTDSFNAQGLEGKFAVRKTLRNAILCTTLIPDYRWQIKY